MKKEYINPKMETIEIKVQQMLTTSVPTDPNAVDPNNSDAPKYVW